MNKSLVEDIVKTIEENPDRFDMARFFEGEDENCYLSLETIGYKESDEPYVNCKTAACVAGHAILLRWKEANEIPLHYDEPGNEYYASAHYLAAELLQIDDETAHCLFYPTAWTSRAWAFIDPHMNMTDEDVALNVLKKALELGSLDFWTKLNEGWREL